MKKALPILVPVLLAGAVYFLNGPYVFPTSAALGPCLKDWTSPSSYTPRSSPLKTLDFSVGSVNARLCYGAPSARGRELFGPSGIVPFGQLWRMGANEPTRLFIDGPIRFGDVDLEAGRYSLYAQPTAGAWQLFLSRSTWHWGNMITSGVRAQEEGSFSAPATRDEMHHEVLRYAYEESSLVLMWGLTRLEMPISERP